MPYKSRKNPRVTWHDYAGGWYFITICAHEMKSIFGSIIQGEFQSSILGTILETEWENTALMRNDVILDIFVVMPNHFHALVGITELRDSSQTSTIPNLIRGFKSRCTSKALELGYTEKFWQRNYHEAILNSQEEWNLVANYIYNNPEVWQQDKYFTI